MHILIVSATIEEIKSSVNFFQDHQIEYLVTGVGMTATAFQLGYYLKDKSFDLIINVGIAGSFSRELPIGTVVRVTNDQLIELGAEDHDQLLSIEELGFGNSKFTENIPQEIQLKFVNFQEVKGITVNRVHGAEASIEKIKRYISTMTVESMEGAAVFYVAQQVKLPVIQLRSISNYVEPRDRAAWKIPFAIEELNNSLVGLLQSVI